MNSPSQSLWPKLPEPIRAFFTLFPLVKYPPILSRSAVTRLDGPVLWIAAPAPTDGGNASSSHSSNAHASHLSAERDVLSADVECLKWQAYLALRGVKGVTVRWDVFPAGAIDGRLPNLHVPPAAGDASPDVGYLSETKDLNGMNVINEKIEGNGNISSSQLLAANDIPNWVDGKLGVLNELEGYVDVRARDESRAWVSLLEGNVHAALLAANPPPLTLVSLLSPEKTVNGTSTSSTLDSVLPTPAAPLFGFSSLLYTTTTRVPTAAIELRYKEAIAALSEQLGTDAWFLGSAAPTFLDALLFAYLHRLLASNHDVRVEVTRRINLVAWERKVASLIRGAFTKYNGSEGLSA